MKKKIPELLDYGDEIVVTDEIKNMFDPEEIKELTMNRIHQEEKKPVRRSAVILLAAALAAVLTATAVAAYTYRFLVAEQFDDYFGGLTEQQAEVMEQIGTGEMPASTANGTTLTPLAVIGDDVRCYMKFRLEAPVGTQLPMTEDELKFLQIFSPDEWYSIVDETGKRLAVSCGEIKWIDTEPGDNVLEFVVCFDSNTGNPAHFSDGKSKLLTIKGIWQEGLDKEYTKLLDGPWSFDIGFYSSADVRTLDVDGLTVKRLFNGVEYEDEGKSMTLRSMSISPLTLTYEYDFTCPDPDVTLPGPGTVDIVMRDGCIAETIRGGGGFWTDSHMAEVAIIQVPIDLDEVAYVQFGNQQIKVN